jgi:hypothetical protein
MNVEWRDHARLFRSKKSVIPPLDEKSSNSSAQKEKEDGIGRKRRKKHPNRPEIRR